jgi:hypothetical protein
VSAIALVAMSRPASVTSSGWPEAIPPLAPVLRTRRTTSQPVPAPVTCDARISDLLTWSAATTSRATPGTAQRIPLARAALSAGMTPMS